MSEEIDIATTDGRARLREMCGRATPGPWDASGIRIKAEALAGERLLQIGSANGICAFVIYSDLTHQAHCEAHADQRFIAVSRTQFPAALDALDQTERRIAMFERDERLYAEARDIIRESAELIRTRPDPHAQLAASTAREARLRELVNRAAMLVPHRHPWHAAARAALAPEGTDGG